MLFAYHLRLASTALGLVAVLASCGGGGGGGGGSPASPGSAATVCVPVAGGACLLQAEFNSRRADAAAVIRAQTAFQNQPDLATIGLDRAHAAIELLEGTDAVPGAGARIAVLDTGIDLVHPAFSGAAGGQIKETILQKLPDETTTTFATGGWSHGTAVASVIVAQTQFLGVAPGANIEVFTVPIDDHLPSQGFIWANAYRSVLNDADGSFHFVNNSYGIPFTLAENYQRENFIDSGGGLLSYANEIAQVGKTDKTVFVWAAGNDYDEPCDITDMDDPNRNNCKNGKFEATSPSLSGGAVAILDEWQGHNVVVVALGEDEDTVNGQHQIADFSNRCGVAASWCIAAPGTEVLMAYFGYDENSISAIRSYAYDGGTSLAAPMVTGGLALMKQAFRSELTNTALVTRLFKTADKTGIYKDANTYGQGAMDLGKALSPFGELSVAVGGLADNARFRLSDTRLGLGEAFGDGPARAFAGREIAAFDSLGAPFWRDLSGLAQNPGPPSAMTRLQKLHEPERKAHAASADRVWRFGLSGPDGVGRGLFALAGHAATLSAAASDSLELSVFTTAGQERDRAPETGARLSWRPEGSGVGVSAGWLGETASLLGSRAEGAFGGLAADSAVFGLEAGGALAGWRLRAEAEFGLAAPDAGGGWIEEVQDMATSAFELQAERAVGARDRISFALSQPLRVEAGRALLTVPTGRTPGGAVKSDSFAAGLVPSARQLDLSVGWTRRARRGGAFRVEAALTRHPGHSKAARDEMTLLAGWHMVL